MEKNSKQKTLFVVTGQSGSGKNWLADEAKKLGVSQVKSFTTRKKREGEDDENYIFIKKENVNSHLNLAFQMFFDHFNCNLYFSTIDLVESAFKRSQNNYALFIATPQSVIGIAELLLRFGIKIVYIHLAVPSSKRVENMEKRGDTGEAIEKRLSTIDTFIDDEYTKFVEKYEHNYKISAVFEAAYAVPSSDRALNVIKDIIS